MRYVYVTDDYGNRRSLPTDAVPLNNEWHYAQIGLMDVLIESVQYDEGWVDRMVTREPCPQIYTVWWFNE